MTDWIAETRRRKLAAYAHFLGAEMGAVAARALDDAAYLHALAEVVALAPPGMALQFGAARRLAELGIVGHLILSAPDLAHTLDVWERHANMAGELASLTSRIEEGRWTLRFTASAMLPAAPARFLIEELVATFFAFAREATGADFSGFETAFPFPQAVGVDYPAYIPGCLRFDVHAHGHPNAALVSGPAWMLEIAHLARDDETFEALRVRLPQSRAERDLPARIRDFLLSSPQFEPRADIVARSLGMSGRTLARRLEGQGTSFGTVLGDYRRALALDLLEGEAGSVARVANLLGYRSENSFRRAFRGWVGTPVAQWRREQKLGKGSLAK